MRRTTIAAAAVLLLPNALAAQREPRPMREMRAFEPAWVAGVGFVSTGDRAESGNVKYGYTNSVTVEFGVDMPLRRRAGVLLSATIAPLAKVRREDAVAVAVTRNAPIIAGDVALGFRLKPWAPAFLAIGGGYTHSTRTPLPAESGGMGAPHVMIAAGFDGQIRNTYGLRLRFALRKVMEASADDPAIEARSPLDLQVSLAVRSRRASFR